MSDLDRAIAIIEDSRQTHVNWADWRRKGNGTDTDHEMIGDLEWHENAIHDYDHVLAVLRAAPRYTCESEKVLGHCMPHESIHDDTARAVVMGDLEALVEGAAPLDRVREAINTTDHPSRTNDEIVAMVREALEGAAPRAEGLDDGGRWGRTGWHTARCWAQWVEVRFVVDEELPCTCRPSDERVPESEASHE